MKIGSQGGMEEDEVGWFLFGEICMSWEVENNGVKLVLI